LNDKKYKTNENKANKTIKNKNKVRLNSTATKPWKGPCTIKKVFKNGNVQLDIGKNKKYVVHQNRIIKAEGVRLKWEEK
jgi:hypothetical protein